MSIIDRNSINDARETIERFIHDEHSRESCLNFLREMILYSDSIDNTNWSLNLDLKGYFLRFNTGQEVCITIYSEFIHISFFKSILEKLPDNNFIKQTDTFAKVPGSHIYEITYDCLKNHLLIFSESCKHFIDSAIKKTRILRQTRAAHSIGAIEYLSKFTKKKVPNPFYLLIDVTDFQNELENDLKKTNEMSDEELERKALKATENPTKVIVETPQYRRSLYISEFVKRKAKGICQDCHKQAPFVNKNTGEPFLETHHITPLSQGGKDSMENVIALCPNCHRKRHYG